MYEGKEVTYEGRWTHEGRWTYGVLLQNWEHCGGYFWIKHCIEVR